MANPGLQRSRIVKRRKFCPQATGVRRMRRTGDQGCDTCIARAYKDVRPGLERSRECAAQWSPWACAKQDSAAQWVYAGPERDIEILPHRSTPVCPPDTILVSAANQSLSSFHINGISRISLSFHAVTTPDTDSVCPDSDTLIEPTCNL